MQPTMADDELRRLMEEIASDPGSGPLDRLRATPALARTALLRGATRASAEDYFLTGIRHYVYAGDTALHIAAAAHRPDVVQALIGLNADPSARNRRGATPLHYAADASPGTSTWSPASQAAAIGGLIDAGADPDAQDLNGATPLHRAVRTRSAAAVKALLAGGADASVENRNGSTPMMLATRTTGRSGSGSPEAKAQQMEIIGRLEGGAR